MGEHRLLIKARTSLHQEASPISFELKDRRRDEFTRAIRDRLRKTSGLIDARALVLRRGATERALLLGHALRKASFHFGDIFITEELVRASVKLNRHDACILSF